MLLTPLIVVLSPRRLSTGKKYIMLLSFFRLSCVERVATMAVLVGDSTEGLRAARREFFFSLSMAAFVEFCIRLKSIVWRRCYDIRTEGCFHAIRFVNIGRKLSVPTYNAYLARSHIRF